jgi:hypothetical protein
VTRINCWPGLVAITIGLTTGCMSEILRPHSPNNYEVIDPIGEANSADWNHREFAVPIERLRRAEQPKLLESQRNILVLSGGGAYGAYSAGVLVGWTKTGTRPEFDVVTGISTGALIAPLAFLGPQYDGQLKEVYTTLSQQQIYRIASLRALFGEGVADSTPLARKIEGIVTPEILKQIAAEHNRGRRLYVGTTDLEAGRAVHWDLGEIAKRSDIRLFSKILLASASIPGFFSPVKIPVTINGQPHIERHIDGGVSNGLFFRPPYFGEDHALSPTKSSLANSNLYILVSGKLYSDPESVRPGPLAVAGHSVSTLLSSQTRIELQKLHTLCLLEGMNYHLSAIPAGFAVSKDATDFDPVKMKAMFDEGFKQSIIHKGWRQTPPGFLDGESIRLRSTVELKRVDPGPGNRKPQLR